MTGPYWIIKPICPSCSSEIRVKNLRPRNLTEKVTKIIVVAEHDVSFAYFGQFREGESCEMIVLDDQWASVPLALWQWFDVGVVSFNHSQWVHREIRHRQVWNKQDACYALDVLETSKIELCIICLEQEDIPFYDCTFYLFVGFLLDNSGLKEFLNLRTRFRVKSFIFSCRKYKVTWSDKYCASSKFIDCESLTIFRQNVMLQTCSRANQNKR